MFARPALRPGIRTAPGIGALVLLVAIVVGGCASATSPSPSGGDRLQVVATTTVFADLVDQVGGDRVSAVSIVPKGGDVHTFDPSPSDVVAVTKAQLIVTNGLGLDDWVTKIIEDAGTSATVVVLGKDVPGVTYVPGPTPSDPPNPHVWMNVAYGERYVERIRDALIAAAPADADVFRANADAYTARLATLDTTIKADIAALPADRRKVVSFHDAFPYFAAAYGLEVSGSIVQAPGQDPSAAQVAALVNAIKAEGVAAIISEDQFSDKLVKTIADETGATVVSDLFDDTLGDPPVDTYEGMMRYDADQIVAALR